MLRQRRNIFPLLFFLLITCCPLFAQPQMPPLVNWLADVRRDTESLEFLSRETDAEVVNGVDRAVGSPGAAKAAEFLALRLAQATNRPVWRQEFMLAAPRIRACWAANPDEPQTRLPLFPLTPAGGQAPALSGNQSTANIVYAAAGRLEELRGKEVRDAWIAVDIGAASTWQTLASLGPRGLIFLGDPQQSVQPFLQLSTSVPVGLPRFYTDDSATVQAIRRGRLARLTIHTLVEWQNVPAENLLVLIPGRQRAAGSTSPFVNQLIVIQTRYDASSQVLGRAPGATQALNAAAALELAHRISRAPEHCSVLIALTAGDEWLFRGSRQLQDLLAHETDPARAIAGLTDDVTRAKADVDQSSELVSGLEKLIAGDLTTLKIASVAQTLRDELDRQTSDTEELLQRKRLDDNAAKDVIVLANQKTQLSSASYAILRHNRIADYQDLIITAAKNTLPVWTHQRDLLAREYRQKTQAAEIRRQIGARKPLLQIELALTTGSPRFGFFTRSNYGEASELAGRMAEFGNAMRRYYDDAHAHGLNADLHFDPDAILPLNTLESYFVVPRGFATDVALHRGQPAGALATILDSTGVMDTPGDRADRINWPNARATLEDVYWLLLGSRQRGTLGMLTDGLFYGRADLSYNTGDQQISVLERTLGETVPRLPAAEYLAGAVAMKAGNDDLQPLQGVRLSDWSITHADGSMTLLGLPRAHRYSFQAFKFGIDGTPASVLSTRSGISNPFELSPGQQWRATVFNADRVDIFGLFDPRYLDQLDRLRLLDARRRDDMPQQSVFVSNGAAAIFMPPRQPWQLLIARGDVANRMLLINADESVPDGKGFLSPKLPNPPLWQTVLDLHYLNSERKRSLESFGISSELMKDLHARATEQVKLAQQARDNLDYAAWFAHANAAWSLEAQIYTNLISTSNGVIYGVIFLLLGIIPFSFFLERLVIGATNVYKQIAWFAAFFALMIGALWFHPAFRISSAPLMILLAFLILLLSGIVVFILFGKFEEEISRLRGQAASAHQANLRRASVLGAAMRLGLSNMRRRLMRTTLTLITLALVTFTLLCFTGISESLALTPALVSRAPENAPPGILLRIRGWRTLPDDTLALARSLAGESGLIAPRYWHASDRPENSWSLPILSADGSTIFNANGLLGLDGNESFFQPGDIEKILPGFSRLATGDDVILLPADLESPTVRVGDVVTLLGRPVTIAGFFNINTVGQLRHLTGDEMFPIDAAGAGQVAPSLPSAQGQQRQVVEQSYRFLSPRRCAIVPATLAESLGARLTSVMLRPAEAADVTPLAQDLARRSAFTLWVSDGQHVYSYNAAASWQPENLSRILVPLLIAGVIVLNTMLGAVSERTREIHVYTSIGLAPAHVGMLFLVEAAALGTLGVVFGYIMGQGLATVLSAFGILRGVDLNYSSTNAIMTMGLVLGLVMLSAIWPARAATRLAAPSLQRDWRLPKPNGDLLAVDLPFTVNRDAAQGVCAFLTEFLVAITQAGSGGFTADHIHPIQFGRARGIRCRVWLAPYDLGVIQSFWLAIHPTDDPHVFDVRLTLVREAGNPATWYRLNRPFLVEVRKQFLLWRQVAPTMMRTYIAQSQELFAQAEHAAPPERVAEITAEKE